MTRYHISFKTDKANGKHVEHVMAIVYRGHGKILDYLRTENVSIMLVDIDVGVVKDLESIGYDVEVEPKITLS